MSTKLSCYDEKVICPYDKCREISRYKIQTNLVKCARSNPDIKLEICPFEVSHRVPVEELAISEIAWILKRVCYISIFMLFHIFSKLIKLNNFFFICFELNSRLTRKTVHRTVLFVTCIRWGPTCCLNFQSLNPQTCFPFFLTWKYAFMWEKHTHTKTIPFWRRCGCFFPAVIFSETKI